MPPTPPPSDTGAAGWSLPDETTTLRAELARLQADNRGLREQLQQLATPPDTQIARLTAQLAATQQELEAFSYAVSHDLRSPLRHIVGYIELFKQHVGEVDAKGSKYLATISDAAQRLGRQIDGLLSYSRIGRAVLTERAVDSQALVQSVVAGLATATEGRTVHWAVDTLPTVHADPVLLREVWTRLLENAAKFTARQPQAQVTVGALTDNPGNTLFFVRDNGAGFDMAHADKLFGMFQRLHHARDFDGMGIGLALARRALERHGGKLWAESQPDTGSCFYFSLPAHAAPQTDVTSETLPQGSPPPNGPTTD